MRLILHIFQKDARRLWYEIAVTLALLVTLAWLEAHRGDPSSGWETLLNVLLSAGWCYLVALSIHGESLAGDRQFWITRPYARSGLLIAKALFVLVFIHLPVFIAHCVIVSGRGFSPLDALPGLVWKQAILAGLITLPAAALASITRSLGQFVTAALLVLTCLGLAVAATPAVSEFDTLLLLPLRFQLLWIAAVAAGIVALAVQYAQRRTILSRVLAGAVLTLGGVLYVLAPRGVVLAAYSRLNGVKTDPGALSVSVDTGGGTKSERPGFQAAKDSVMLSIPIRISGLEPGSGVYLSPLCVRIIGPGGASWDMAQEALRWSPVEMKQQQKGHLRIPVDRGFYDRVKEARVTVVTEAAALLYREREAGRMPSSKGAVVTPELGRCSSALTILPTDVRVSILCESPVDKFLSVRAKLSAPGGWTDQAQSSLAVTHAISWLSSVNRRRLSISAAQLTGWNREDLRAAMEDLSRREVVLSTVERVGSTILKYELRDLDLRQFVSGGL